MRTVVTCLLAITVLINQEVYAASSPVKYFSSYSPMDSGIKKSVLLTRYVFTPHKKAGLIKKLQSKLLQKKLSHLSTRFEEGETPRRNLLSTISLILGIVGLVAIFISAIGGISLIAAPAALVTGIIALSRRYNNSKASRTKAIIDLVLGSVLTFLILLAIILIASSGWGWLVFAGM